MISSQTSNATNLVFPIILIKTVIYSVSNFNQEISFPYSLPHRFDDFYIYFPRNLRDCSFRMGNCYGSVGDAFIYCYLGAWYNSSQYSDKETKAESGKATGRKGKI